jgi:hypothetical protein
MATTDALIAELKKRYDTAGKREVVTAIPLFGVAFADDLDGQPISEIAERVIGHRSFGSEIRKGMRLAKYVSVKHA